MLSLVIDEENNEEFARNRIVFQFLEIGQPILRERVGENLHS
jgi:hypothetical protein